MTKFMIVDPRFTDRKWPCREDELKKLMGIQPPKKWPDEGMGTYVIQGIQVYVLPRKPGRFQLRARAICPGCGKDFAAGRIAQHVCKA